MSAAVEYRTVGIRTTQYELLRKMVTHINKHNPRTKDGVQVTVRIGDVLGFAIEYLARQQRIK